MQKNDWVSRILAAKRLGVVFLLGFSSGLPFCLLGSTLQAWYAKDGQSIVATSMLSLLGIPYIVRFLWAPLIDEWFVKKLGRRRSWLIITQIGLLLGLLLLSFLSPKQNSWVFVMIATILVFFSASQDGVIDAHRIEYLKKDYHPLGAAFASTAYRFSMLLSGGYALVMAERYGWAVTYQIMALMMLIGLLASLLSKEPDVTIKAPTESAYQLYFKALLSIFKTPQIAMFLGFIFFYKLGEVFTSNISGIVMPFLIYELKFSLSTIGYVNKVLGTIALIAGGLVAGFSALRYSLSHLLLVFGLLQAITNGLFVVLALKGPDLFWFATAVVSDNFATGLGSTALVALLMRIVNKEFTATQFSMLMAFASLPRVFSGPMGVFMQSTIGWAGLYQVSVLLALIFIPFWFKIRKSLDEPCR